MSQGYPYPPSYPNHRSSSSSTSSSSSSSSSSRPRAHPYARPSSSSHQPSPLAHPPTSRENPICIDDNSSPEPEEIAPPSSSIRRPSPPNPQRAPPPPPVSSSSAPRPTTATSRKRSLGPGFSIEEERTTAKSSRSSAQPREDGPFDGRGEKGKRTKLNNDDDGRSPPSLSNPVGALDLFPSGFTQDSESTTHRVASSRPNGSSSFSSSSKLNSTAPSTLSWTRTSTEQRQGRVDKGKGREEPRNTSRMLPPPPPSSSHPSKASSDSGRSLADFFSRPSNPPSEHDLPSHLSPRTSWTATSSPSSSSQAPSAASASAPAPYPSSSSSPRGGPTPSSSSSQPSHKRPPSSTPANTKKSPLSVSKLPCLEIDGVEWIPHEIDLTSDSPPSSPSHQSSSSRAPKHPIEPPRTQHGRSSSAARRRAGARDPIWTLTGRRDLPLQIGEDEKDQDLRSWRISASLRSPPLSLLLAPQEQEDHVPEAPGALSSTSSLSLVASSSSAVKHHPKPQSPPASIPSVASSSSSLPKLPLPSNQPVASSSTSSTFKVVSRAAKPFPFSFSIFPEKEAPAPPVPFPLVPSKTVVDKKPAQPSVLPKVHVPPHSRPTRAVKRARPVRKVIDISDSESDSDDDGTTEIIPIAPPSLVVPAIPSSVRLTRKTQHSSLQRFQHQIDHQLSATPTVSSVTFVGQTVPQNFKYKECCVEPGAIGSSKDLSLALCPGDCIHCRGGADKDLKALTNSGSVRVDLLNGKRKFWEECGTCCPNPTTCPFRTSRNSIRDFAVKIFETPDKGYGVETVVALPKKKFIGIYSGLLYDTKVIEAISTGCYLFGLQGPGDDDDDEEPCRYEFDLTIDAEKQGNFTRFLNHSCDANVTSVTIIRRDIPGYLHREIPIIGIFTNRDIPAGSELTLNYRGDNPYRTYSPEEVSEWDKICQCGAGDLCLGRLNL